MDNLINFDDFGEQTKPEETKLLPRYFDAKPVCPSIHPQRLSVDQSNPFEATVDPFEVNCLEKFNTNPNGNLDLKDGSE